MGLFRRLFGKKAKKDNDELTNAAYDEGLKEEYKIMKAEEERQERANFDEDALPFAYTNSAGAPKPIKKAARPTQELAKKASEPSVISDDEAKSKTANEGKRSIKSESAAPAKVMVKKCDKKPVDTTDEKPLRSTVKKKAEKPAEVAKKTEDRLESKAKKSGKFEIKKSKDGRFIFNLYAANHVIIATSQIYSSSTAAMNGIKSVMTNAESAPVEDQTLKNYETLTYPKWEIYQDKGGDYRFRLNASNGSCICHSQGYTSKANCKGGIESIIKFAKDAQIDKSYLKKD